MIALTVSFSQREKVPPTGADEGTSPRQTVTKEPAAGVDGGLALEADAGALSADDDAQDEPDAGAETDFELGEGPQPAGDGGIRYTRDLSDEELKRRWVSDPASLSSVAFGLVEQGRLYNGVRFPEGDGWVVVSEQAYATQETVEMLTSAFRAWRVRFPEAPPMRVNAISGPEGGYIRPHTTHQNGRDADIGFVYPTSEQPKTRAREKVMDLEKNWVLVKEILAHGDVQYILLDYRVQAALYKWALAHGEDKAWLDSLFHAGMSSVFFHARRHRDHFHVRLYNPRAQELGRRLQPLLALRADQNLAFHRVQRGDTLSRIAWKYGSSIRGLRAANKLKTDFLSLGRVLQVPLRKPCVVCPLPPEVVLPSRRVAPGALAEAPKPVAEPAPSPPEGAGPVMEPPDRSWSRSPGVW